MSLFGKSSIFTNYDQSYLKDSIIELQYDNDSELKNLVSEEFRQQSSSYRWNEMSNYVLSARSSNPPIRKSIRFHLAKTMVKINPLKKSQSIPSNKRLLPTYQQRTVTPISPMTPVLRKQHHIIQKFSTQKFLTLPNSINKENNKESNIQRRKSCCGQCFGLMNNFQKRQDHLIFKTYHQIVLMQRRKTLGRVLQKKKSIRVKYEKPKKQQTILIQTSHHDVLADMNTTSTQQIKPLLQQTKRNSPILKCYYFPSVRICHHKPTQSQTITTTLESRLIKSYNLSKTDLIKKKKIII